MDFFVAAVVIIDNDDDVKHPIRRKKATTSFVFLQILFWRSTFFFFLSSSSSFFEATIPLLSFRPFFLQQMEELREKCISRFFLPSLRYFSSFLQFHYLQKELRKVLSFERRLDFFLSFMDEKTSNLMNFYLLIRSKDSFHLSGIV